MSPGSAVLSSHSGGGRARRESSTQRVGAIANAGNVQVVTRMRELRCDERTDSGHDE